MPEERKDFDAGDQQAVRKRKTKAQLREDQAVEEFKKLLGTWEGRRFVWWLLNQSGMYRTSFEADPHITAFNEGMRQIGIRVVERIFQSDPHAYSKMRSEAERVEEKS